MKPTKKILNQIEKIEKAESKYTSCLDELAIQLTEKLNIEGLRITVFHQPGDGLCAAYIDEFGELDIPDDCVVPVGELIRALPVKDCTELPTGF